MFEETCRIKSTWKGTKYEHIPISINMSRLHLYNQAYPDQLVEIAGRYQIPTNELELEVTESIFLKDSTELIRMINQLQDRGFMISIDDFGSGFSALNLLKDLNANTIKLDREFLSDSSNSTRGKKIIRNVIALCLDLKMDVVTEGIETKDQIDFITRCGCQIGQGFVIHVVALALIRPSGVYPTSNHENTSFLFRDVPDVNAGKMGRGCFVRCSPAKISGFVVVGHASSPAAMLSKSSCFTGASSGAATAAGVCFASSTAFRVLRQASSAAA